MEAMEEIDSSPVSPNPRKRQAPADEVSPEKKPLNLKGTQFMMPTPPDTDQSSNASPTCLSNNTLREVSPAPSNSTLTSIDTTSPLMQTDRPATGDANPGTAQDNTTGQPPAKKRKLTPAEKEHQQKEKEARAAERAEQKAKKDEEKRIREEEKRVRDEERRRKAEDREAKKREKEIEEDRKNEAKLKKERSQMRLGVFFQKPVSTTTTSSESPAPGSARRKSLSLEPFDAHLERPRASVSPCKQPQPSASSDTAAMAPDNATTLEAPAKPSVSDYQKYFLPFQLQTHSSLPQPVQNEAHFDHLQDAFDHETQDPSLRKKCDLGLVDSYATLESHFADERCYSRGIAQADMRQLVDQIQGSSFQPIDLTEDQSHSNPMHALHSISRRHIQFYEDVRPAYFGTYTKIRSPRICSKLRRNPFSRSRKDIDYDYDSEAEWQEEEEGEDILDEEDDEAESVAEADEMDEFLDDEDDSLKGKRKMISGDLIPTCTGLCWENERGKLSPDTAPGETLAELRDMRIGFLLPGFSGKTIDPFSTSYWESESAPAPVAPSSSSCIRESPFAPPVGVMAPPRPPLQPRPNSNTAAEKGLIGAAQGMKGPITSVSTQHKAKTGPKPAPKALSKEDLEEFKEAVVGSQLSKADLLKGLKSRFPKITNDTIKSTLGEHFAQVGASKADKKWVYVNIS